MTDVLVIGSLISDILLSSSFARSASQCVLLQSCSCKQGAGAEVELRMSRSCTATIVVYKLGDGYMCT